MQSGMTQTNGSSGFPGRFIHRSWLICDIVEEEFSIRWGPKPVKEMTDEEVLLQAVQICNVFIQEKHDEQMSIPE